VVDSGGGGRAAKVGTQVVKVKLKGGGVGRPALGPFLSAVKAERRVAADLEREVELLRRDHRDAGDRQRLNAASIDRQQELALMEDLAEAHRTRREALNARAYAESQLQGVRTQLREIKQKRAQLASENQSLQQSLKESLSQSATLQKQVTRLQHRVGVKADKIDELSAIRQVCRFAEKTAARTEAALEQSSMQFLEQFHEQATQIDAQRSQLEAQQAEQAKLSTRVEELSEWQKQRQPAARRKVEAAHGRSGSDIRTRRHGLGSRSRILNYQ